MLDFIYWPVSAIMWAWHWLFSHVTPDTPGGNGVAWALSVVFLVFSLRAILYKPFVRQIQTTRKMQEINPQMQAIRKKYSKDRVKMTEEMQKLQREHGFNPLLGCLPMFLQIPVFIGLFHVLRSFNRTAHGIGQLGMTPEQTREFGNYAFSKDLVQNFLDSRFFGVPLSSFVTQPQTEWVAFVKSLNPADVDFTRVHIGIVVIPIVIIASIATHMNSRASVARQPAAALENPQTRIMNNLSLYIFPLGILVTGAFFPVAILLYWVSNNLWTYVQQHVVFGRIEREEKAAAEAKQEKLKANAPKPGARPDRSKKAGGDATKTPDGEEPAAESPEPAPSSNGVSPRSLMKRFGRKADAKVPDPEPVEADPTPAPDAAVEDGGTKAGGAKSSGAKSGQAKGGGTSGTAKSGAGKPGASSGSGSSKPSPGQRPNKPGGRGGKNAKRGGNRRPGGRR